MASTTCIIQRDLQEESRINWTLENRARAKLNQFHGYIKFIFKREPERLPQKG